MFKLFKKIKCFETPVEVEEEEPVEEYVYKSTLDYDNVYDRIELLELICKRIKYDDTNPNICVHIDNFRALLSFHLKDNVMPMYFQQTAYFNTKDKLEDVVFNKFHSTNVKTLLDFLKKEEKKAQDKYERLNKSHSEISVVISVNDNND